MEIGYGPHCAKVAGVRYELKDNQVIAKERLAVIDEPMFFDVVLKRDGADTSGEAITNVPWSVIWHSPDGFNWGYGGSGPADLALNILNAYVPPGTDGLESVKCYQGECSATASYLHQEFKREIIAAIPVSGATIYAETIHSWIKKKKELLPESFYIEHQRLDTQLEFAKANYS